MAGGVPPSRPKSPPGFSLIELTAGMLLLEVGVLALAATAGNIVRLTTLGGREGGSALVAAARLEALRASACAPTAGASGAATDVGSSGAYDERWSVASDGSARTVQLAVSYADGRRTRTALYETVIACAP